MIKEILEKDFMLKSSATLKRSGERLIKNFENSPEIQTLLQKNKIEIKDLKVAHDEIEFAIQREEKRQTEKAELNDSVYLPHDPIMCQIQSSLQKYCESQKSENINGKSEETIKLFNGEDIPITDIGLDENLKLFLTDEEVQKAFGKYEYDIGWANCLIAAGIRRLKGRHPFNHQPATPFKIGNNARVILLSDWGSGLPRAQKVSQVVANKLHAADTDNRDRHVIHLGDVYYSGWAEEYEKNFLPYWPVKKNERDKISSWSLNANHDMYSGGDGYFETLLGDERFNFQEKSSFFSLENDNWLLLGLDTGYDENFLTEEHSLYGKQDEWAYKKLLEADSKNKTGILLSHHQPFSAFAKGGERLLAKLQKPLSENLVEAWFWGHEHRCTAYKAKENINFPRCIGHAGIPFYVENNPYPTDVCWEYREGFVNLLEEWNYFGFVMLDFNEENIEVSYIGERGDIHYNEIIKAKKNKK